MKKTSILLLGFLALFPACETDFEINAPWKDITIVYGLLNQQDTVHYIKINKAFLGDTNALVMALIPDSSQYDTSEIKVTIQQTKDGDSVTTYTLYPIFITNKEEGVFYNTPQIVYQFTEPNLDEDSDYKLTITNKKTGKIVTATTPIIDEGVWCFNTECIPSAFPGMKIGFYNTVNNSYQSLVVKWKSVEDGRRYQLTIRFKYDEKNTDTGVITPKSVDWIFSADSRVDYLKGNISISRDVNGEEFYKFLASRIPDNDTPIPPPSNVERFNVTLDFIIDVAGEEFNTYMEVNEPSTGIVQEKPEYSNIKNDKTGEDEIGIFSCRYYEIRGNKELSFDSEVWLQEPSSPTAGLGFKLQ